MTKKADETKPPEGAQTAPPAQPPQEPTVAPEKVEAPKVETKAETPAREPEPPRTLTEEEIWENATLYNKMPPAEFDIDKMVARYRENELPALAAMVGRRIVGIQQMQDGTIGLVMRNDLLADGDCTLWIKSEPLGGPGFAAITTTTKN